MVGEFPEVQGIMGREYALLEGEDAAATFDKTLHKMEHQVHKHKEKHRDHKHKTSVKEVVQKIEDNAPEAE